MNLPHVCFVGLGYIGLPTAVVMANSGVQVTGVDINKNVVSRINKGETTIVEPGLEEALSNALDTGRFRATTDMPHAETYILAVPTPFDANRDIDMSYIFSAAQSIAPMLEGGELVVLESTASPRSTERMANKILELRPDLTRAQEDATRPTDIYFAHCPERILPGNALEELVANDRIIGGETKGATNRAKKVYASFCDGELLETDAITAEMAKITENSFRDVNIAFANELSIISDGLGINVWELIRLANHHPRVNILQPGPGVGGHCIAVDPWFIVSADKENSRLIRTAREVNDLKPSWVVNEAISSVEEMENPTIAALGLAFKANIDDLRESPSVDIVKSIAEAKPSATILAVEPNIANLPAVLEEIPNVTLSKLSTSLEKADLVLILVDHLEFAHLTAEQFEGTKLIDTKGLVDRSGEKG